MEDDDENQHESQVYATEEITEEEFFESLLQEADEDAALIADYESAMAVNLMKILQLPLLRTPRLEKGFLIDSRTGVSGQ